MCCYTALWNANVNVFARLFGDVNKDWTHKDKDKDLKLVLKESLRTRTRTRTRINITDIIAENKVPFFVRHMIE